MSRHKYGAKPTTVNGIRFASTAEANRYQELCLLQRAGLIRDLECQPKYRIDIEGEHVCTVIGDFRYFHVEQHRTVVEDVKGMDTALSRLKRKLVHVVHGVDIEIVKQKARGSVAELIKGAQ